MVEQYNFTFKFIYEFPDTNNKKTNITVNSNITIKEFVEHIEKIGKSIFAEYHLWPFKLEIVEAGQYNNHNGIEPELADKLEACYDENATLEQIFGNRWKNTAFYIRIS